MKFRSTRGGQVESFIPAILEGLAVDGGLFVPQDFPQQDWSRLSDHNLQEVAAEVFQLFGGEALDWPFLAESAFNFSAPIVDVRAQRVLELFHGPTAAFKDFGARFLACVLSNVAETSGTVRTVLVATSGDTGGAVASAFEQTVGTRVIVLYPKGMVSKRQEVQLTCWGDRVTALCVDGTFDDCQRMVKTMFANPDLKQRFALTSANSINLGRLVPQMAYYAWASLNESKQNDPVSFAVPTGNLGNALACVWAKKIGFPIGDIRLATNANASLTEFFERDFYEAKDATATLANAMDVGAPSNFERLRDLFATSDAMRAFGLSTASVNDETIRDQIKRTFERDGYVLDPHTACAMQIAHEGDVVVSTAHPSKFETVVEPLVGPVELAPQLVELMDRSTEKHHISADAHALLPFLEQEQ